MHPFTLKCWQALGPTAVPDDVRKVLTGPHHFHVRKQVVDVAVEIAEAEHRTSTSGDPLVFPVLGRLPAAEMVLTMNMEGFGYTEDGGIGLLVLRQGIQGGMVDVTMVCPDGYNRFGAYLPGSNFLREGHLGNLGRTLLVISLIVSLINQPRLVQAIPAAGLEFSRQHQKAVTQVTGKAALAFSVVSWKIGKAVIAKSMPLSTQGHRKALHWCRSHWRRAGEGDPKAEFLNIRRLGGWGFYCWVKDCWKGHPDFGIKLQRHEPMFGDEPRSRYLGGESVLDSTRLEAMGAAQRAALVEAGFAPSASVH